MLAAILFATSLLGRWTVQAGDVSESRALIATLERQAARRADVDGYLDNPLTYSNVSMRLRGERLSLSFDVSRHLEIETDPRSPLARDVLLASIVEAPLSGQRIRAIQVAGSTGDAGLREAVVFALRHDPDIAVRLEALETLRRAPDGPEVRAAALEALGNDPSVHLRLLALEFLEGRAVDATTLREAIGTRGLEGDAALLQRTVQMERRKL